MEQGLINSILKMNNRIVPLLLIRFNPYLNVYSYLMRQVYLVIVIFCVASYVKQVERLLRRHSKCKKLLSRRRRVPFTLLGSGYESTAFKTAIYDIRKRYLGLMWPTCNMNVDMNWLPINVLSAKPVWFSGFSFLKLFLFSYNRFLIY
jgi:preprotein translocase subunit SecY